MYDFQSIEEKWQKRWEESKIFEVEHIKNRKKWFITVPYPYTNAPLHIGHGRTYTIGDIAARFRRMQGYHVLFPMAFHMTGTPVLGVSSRIKEGDKETISLYKRYVRQYITDEKEIEKIVKSFEDPWTTAKFFADHISADFKSLGYSIDWRRRFTTGDKIYNQFVTWQFLKMNERGYIVNGTYPILYCPHCKNAVGEDDLLEGEDASVRAFTTIKFPFDDKFLVAATLRPETIFGATNLWINPDVEYAEVDVNGEIWIISKRAYEKLTYQKKGIKLLRTFKGNELIGKSCKSPISDINLPILPASFVDPDNATGVVYSVPAHAPYDYIALRDLWENESEKAKIGKEIVDSIKLISIISIEGYGEYPAKEIVEKMKIKNQNEHKKLEEATQTIYKAEFYHGVMKDNCGPFKGKLIRDVKEDVIDWLKKDNISDDFYEPDKKPVTCRCGTPVLVAVLANQWFIDYNAKGWKDLAYKELHEMEIVPSVYRTLFENTFEWLDRRPCARRRGIGTKLPFDKDWIIESLSDSTIYMAFYTIAHIIHRNNIPPEKLTPELFDYVFLGRGSSSKLSKSLDLPKQVIEEMRQEFDYWYPLDQRHTAISHITNHLSFFIFHHVAIFPEEKWPRAITLNEHVIREGRKMSKSKGNVIPLVDIPKKYGVDLYRLYVAVFADLATIIDWKEKDVPSVRSKLTQFWNLSNQILEMNHDGNLTTNYTPTKWLLSTINTIIKEATNDLERYRFRDYALKVAYEMPKIISKYLKRTEVDISEKGNALWYTLDRWVRLMAPITPHICEEIWEKMGNSEFVSLAKWPTPDESLIDKNAELGQIIVDNLVNDIREILKLIKDKAPKKAHIYIAPEWKYDVLRRLSQYDGPLTIKEMMPYLLKNAELKRYSKQLSPIVQKIAKENSIWTFLPSADEEYKVFLGAKDYISAETGMEIEVYSPENISYDPAKKSKHALPGRPSILLE